MCQSLTLSIVIPARNEERCLPKCLEAIKISAKNAGIVPEIVVVLNRCSDGTEKIALSAGCRVIKEDGKNLSIIRNAGVAAATGEHIVTIDADSYMSGQMLPHVLKRLANPDCVGGGVLMMPERFSLGILATFICLIPIALWYGISGGLFYFRKSDFEAIGGFNPELLSAEDIDFAKRLKAHGHKNKRRFKTIFTSLIITSCRKFDLLGDWYFILHPLEMWKLLGGKDKAAADKIWYDFPRP